MTAHTFGLTTHQSGWFEVIYLRQPLLDGYHHGWFRRFRTRATPNAPFLIPIPLQWDRIGIASDYVSARA
jgi:hypothetical protein